MTTNVNYSECFESIIKNYQCNENLKKLLLLFFDINKYKTIVKTKIDEQKNAQILEGNLFEILLYSYRFCINSLNKKEIKNCLYSSILSKDSLNSIKNSFIPGSYNSENSNKKEENNQNIKIGINIESKDEYILYHKKIRKLSEISFRLLNFILYSHLFFANCLNYFPDNELSKIRESIGMNFLEIIQTNWNLLDEALRKKNVIFIQIFINLIFKRLSELIKKCNLIKKENDLNRFEEKIESLVNDCIKEYPEYSKKYLEANEKLMVISKENIRAILSELYPPTEENYPYKEYPFLKYFTYTRYKSINKDLKKELGPEEKCKNEFPLLYKYLEVNEDKPYIKKLKYLPIFNEITNILIYTYSFNITREDAKMRSLVNENIYNELEYKNKIDEFIIAWNQIKDKAVYYQNEKMEIKNLSKTDKLAFFLNDNNEPGYGMYIAAAYNNFINWQNGFLKYIIQFGAHNKYLNYYFDNMNKKSLVQEANSNQILQVDYNNDFSDSYLENFENLVNTFSRRNIFMKNGEINYLNYNSFIYDLPQIEEELGKIILSGKCLFEDKLKFVNYFGEGSKSEIMNKFYEKYKQKDLTQDEKKILQIISRRKKMIMITMISNHF